MDRLVPLNWLWPEHMDEHICQPDSLFIISYIFNCLCLSVTWIFNIKSAQLLVNILNFLFNVQLKPELLIKYWGVYRISTSLRFTHSFSSPSLFSFPSTACPVNHLPQIMQISSFKNILHSKFPCILPPFYTSFHGWPQLHLQKQHFTLTPSVFLSRSFSL